jgi:hypothetical protein
MSAVLKEGVQDFVDLTPYDVLRRELQTDVITYGALHENFVSKCVPHMVVARVHFTLPQLVNGKMPFADTVMSEATVERAYTEGAAICNFVDNVLAQEHPQDKRFLLRYMEQLCMRYGKSNDRALGFGHDIIYSRDPIGTGFYKAFDNTLYIPPLTGHWAIASKGSARD